VVEYQEPSRNWTIPAYSPAAARKPLHLRSFGWFVCSHVLCLVGLLGNAVDSDLTSRMTERLGSLEDGILVTYFHAAEASRVNAVFTPAAVAPILSRSNCELTRSRLIPTVSRSPSCASTSSRLRSTVGAAVP
jgi:hypothetical protein